MKAFFSRSWPLLILLILVAAMTLRATHVRNEAANSVCQPSQTLVVNYFAVPHFQSAVSCKDN